VPHEAAQEILQAQHLKVQYETLASAACASIANSTSECIDRLDCRRAVVLWEVMCIDYSNQILSNRSNVIDQRLNAGIDQREYHCNHDKC
jgi:hypothetical protein